MREEGRRSAEATGGRRPTHRRAVPIALAGTQCAVLAAASFVGTQRAVAAFAQYDPVVANKTLILNLTVAAGVGACALLVVSTAILFSVAWKVGTPVRAPNREP